MPEFQHVQPMEMVLLYVESEDKTREQFLKVLSRRVTRVIAAKNGKEGLARFLEFKPDIVITDVRMPEMDGLEMCRLIRETGHNTQIVIDTAYEDMKTFLEAIEIGVNHYLVKPLRLDRLESVLNHCYRTILLERDIKMKTDLIKKLSVAVEQSPATVIITDITGMIEYVNPKFTELTGYEPHEVAGKNIRILKSGMTADDIYRDLWTTITAGKEWSGEIINRKKNGELYWEMSYIAPVRSEKGRVAHYVAVKEDITAKKNAEEALLKSERDLRRRNEIIENDLFNAQIIQRALLPQKPPEIAGFNIDYRYLPLESVGGDYFSFTVLREGGLGLFIGDVTGHGVSAALFLALVKAFTDRVCRQHGQHPKEYFRQLNRELSRHLSMNYLTAIYGLLRVDISGNKSEFRFVKAGHPPPILYRKNTGETSTLNPRGGMLGVIEETPFDEELVELYPGDRIFLYTDGVHETMNDKGEIYGVSRFCGLIKNLGNRELKDVLDGVIDALRTYRGDEPERDDTILIGIEMK